MNLFGIPKKATTKMSTTTLNLLSNQWISYGSSMLFKSKYVPQCFHFHFTCSFSVFVFIAVLRFSSYRHKFVIIMKYDRRKTYSTHYVLFFFSWFGNSWAKNESNYHKYFKRSFLTQVFWKTSPKLYNKMDIRLVMCLSVLL